MFYIDKLYTYFIFFLGAFGRGGGRGGGGRGGGGNRPGKGRGE